MSRKVQQQRVRTEIERLQLLQESALRTPGMLSYNQYLAVGEEIHRLQDLLNQLKSSPRDKRIADALLWEVERLGHDTARVQSLERSQELLNQLKSSSHTDNGIVRALLCELKRLDTDTNPDTAGVKALKHEHECTERRKRSAVRAGAPRAAVPPQLRELCTWCENNAVDAAILLAAGVGGFYVSKAIFGLVAMVLLAIVSVADMLAIGAVIVFGLLVLKSLFHTHVTRVRDSRRSPHPGDYADSQAVHNVYVPV
jgi:hypothetical protein